MAQITVIIGLTGGLTGQPYFQRLLDSFIRFPVVSKVMIISPEHTGALPAKCDILEEATSGAIVNRLLMTVDTPYVLFLSPTREIKLGANCLERFLEVAGTVRAGMVYSDFYESTGGELREHPVNDYQIGSIRDDFDFGFLALFSVSAARHALSKYKGSAPYCYAGWYDLRLKISLEQPLFHIQECLYTVMESEEEQSVNTHFAYLDPINDSVQKEMEEIATAHLRRLGAYLAPAFESVPPSRNTFPVEASVVIPVRNRVRTIADAVQSALSQTADFSFNVLVVDNHSSDGTTACLREISKQRPALRHIIPSRQDLSIGGCWNEAVFSPDCGRYAVQLDSDDLYSSPQSLQKIFDLLTKGNYAMVVGSYSIVNAELEEIPPGLVDHREWTATNGRNNALRINGLGAPRAFNTEVLRQFGFLNVGYGEDYAMALRITREYQIGRIYENLYLCRRWEGNSDASLTVAQKNRHDAFKDKIRTIEIMARQELNRQKGRESQHTDSRGNGYS